jgi:anaerobic selenocysteine-containing dehydrogenase
MHPEDAERTGVSGDERIVVVSEEGSLVAPLELDRRVTPGVVQATTHFSDLEIQRVTEDGILTPVRIEKVQRG